MTILRSTPKPVWLILLLCATVFAVVNFFHPTPVAGCETKGVDYGRCNPRHPRESLPAAHLRHHRPRPPHDVAGQLDPSGPLLLRQTRRRPVLSCAFVLYDAPGTKHFAISSGLISAAHQGQCEFPVLLQLCFRYYFNGSFESGSGLKTRYFMSLSMFAHRCGVRPGVMITSPGTTCLLIPPSILVPV